MRGDGQRGSGAALDRRGLLLGSLFVGGVAARAAEDARAPGPGGPPITGEVPWKPGGAANPQPAAAGTVYQWFTPAEAAFIEAAIDRLIPRDAHGAGAKDAGVAVFLDRQLAGPYGAGDHFYLQGPFAKGEKTQGYQLRFTPAELYRTAIRAIDAHCAQQRGHAFAVLSASEQDAVLGQLETGAIVLAEADAGTFFTMLLQNTIEGFFADPIYGGNRDLIAWKMIGFPGSHYDYSEWIHRHNERWPYPPVGLQGRAEWRRV